MKRDYLINLIAIILFVAFAVIALVSLNGINTHLQRLTITRPMEPTTIIVKNETLPAEEIKEEPAVSVEPVEVPKMKTMLCPYCHEGLSIFSSSYLTSMAQMRCYHCGYCSPEVKSDKPDAEMECIETLKDRLMNGGWSEHDFTGE